MPSNGKTTGLSIRDVAEVKAKIPKMPKVQTTAIVWRKAHLDSGSSDDWVTYSAEASRIAYHNKESGQLKTRKQQPLPDREVNNDERSKH